METPFDFEAAKPAERNDFIAKFMPPGICNPLRQWGYGYLLAGEKHWGGRLLLESESEVQDWINQILVDQKTFHKCFPRLKHWTLEQATARLIPMEQTWSLRYSDTPGGAWDMVDQLQKEGWWISIDIGSVISIRVRDDANRLDLNMGMTARPFAEFMAITFLKVKGAKFSYDINK